MISIRCGKGLGDSIYLQSIARHFVDKGSLVEVCTQYPDVFRPLAGAIKVSPFRKTRIDRLAHYSMRRSEAGTDQFQDCCIQAGISGDVPLRLDWRVIGTDLAPSLIRLARGRPIIVVKLAQPPFDRADGWGIEFLPDCRAIQRIIDHIGQRALKVQVGAGKDTRRYDGIDVDLTNRTTVCDLLDVSAVADGFVGQCSFLVPLAASVAKPGLFVWSRRGLESSNRIVRLLTPQKVLHGEGLAYVIDDCSETELAGAVDALLGQTASRIAA